MGGILDIHVTLLHLGHPHPISMDPYGRLGAHIKLRHTHHLTLLASCLGSGNVRMSPLQTGLPFTCMYGGVVSVIQDLKRNLCMSLSGARCIPTLSAIYSSQTLDPGLISDITLVKITSLFVLYIQMHHVELIYI